MTLISGLMTGRKTMLKCKIHNKDKHHPEYRQGYVVGYNTGYYAGRRSMIKEEGDEALWILKDGEWYCSKCGTRFGQDHEDFCCKCGSKMNLEEAELEEVTNGDSQGSS